MSSGKSALVIGATGLIGKGLLRHLVHSPNYSRVRVLTRRNPELAHEKLEVILTDFKDLQPIAGQIQADDVFSALGTTLKAAGSREAFREVDFHYNLEVARIASRNGAKKYLLVSSLGASPDSPFFYVRVKGELEEAVKKLEFSAIHVFRPSLLLGDRDEKRPAEKLAKWLNEAAKPWIVGKLKKFQPIEAGAVAQAMIVVAQREDKGFFVHESEEIQRIKDWMSVG